MSTWLAYGAQVLGQILDIAEKMFFLDVVKRSDSLEEHVSPQSGGGVPSNQLGAVRNETEMPHEEGLLPPGSSGLKTETATVLGTPPRQPTLRISHNHRRQSLQFSLSLSLVRLAWRALTGTPYKS